MTTRTARVLVAGAVVAGLAGCSAVAAGAVAAAEAAAAPVPATRPSAAAQPPAAPAPSLVGAAYTSPDGYSISPPAGWRVFPVDSSRGVSSAFAATQLDQGTTKPFAANLNVVVTPETRSLDAVVAEAKAQIPGILRNYKLVIDKPTGNASQPAHILGSTYDAEVGQLKNVQLLTLKGGKGFIVTYTSSATSYDALFDAIQASLNTFALN